MRNSKLYSILEHFDKYELNRLRKYLTSPYFNRDQTLVDLFELLLKDIEKPQGEELEKETLWKALDLDAPYNDVRFRKYFSDLLKLVEGFLAQQVFEENRLQKSTCLIEAVGRKKLEKLFSSTMGAARKLSKKEPFRPATYYYYQYEIEKRFYELNESDIKRTDRTNLESIIKNLDFFYLAEKLRLYCSVLSRQYVVSHEYELLFIEEIIQHIKNYNFDHIPPIAVYYQVYLTQVEADNEAHYFKLKEVLESNRQFFPQKEAYILYSYALNYCIRKFNKGNAAYFRELFELYKMLIDSKIIFNDQELSQWDFKNIILTAIRLKEYPWAENFIHKFGKYLPEKSRDNAVTYNLAQLYFYQKRYDEFIEKLRDVEFDDFSYNLNSKSLLLATYYEIDEIEPLYSLTESFRTYLNRHKEIPSQRKVFYLNLIKFTKRLTKVLPSDKQAISKLKTEIESNNLIAMRNWLKDKINELDGALV